MEFEDVLAALTDEWDDVRERLPSEVGQRLTILVEAFAAATEAYQRDRIAREIIEILLDLPQDHPVRRLLLASRTRFASTDPIAGTTVIVVAPDEAGVAEEIRDRLLRGTMLTASQVLDLGSDPYQAGILRLRSLAGDLRIPAFQFGAGGQPVPVVLEINMLLGAVTDPWGVADWWQGTNMLINGTPAQAIGQVPDAVLVGAARAVLAED